MKGRMIGQIDGDGMDAGCVWSTNCFAFFNFNARALDDGESDVMIFVSLRYAFSLGFS